MSESSSNLSREYSQKHIRGGEKKVMKKTLSSVVSIALISSMFATAAFAAEATPTAGTTTTTSATATKELTIEQKYEALKALGILEGDGTGANLEGLTDRAQIAKIIAKTFKLTEDASGASVYTDAAFKTPEYSWSLGFVGAVTKAGYMDGVWDKTFAPTSKVTLQELATILVRAFKLEHPKTEKVEGKVDEWAQEYVAAAIKAGLISAKTDYTAQAKRSDLVESGYTAVKKVEEGTKPVVTAKLTGVSGLTNAKVKITFDAEVKAIDKSSVVIKDEAGAAVEVKDVALASDGKSAVVTTVALNGYNKYTLTVKDVTKNFVAMGVDSDKPVAKTAVIGQDAAITVTFNEAVDAATATNVANYVLDPSVKVKSATLNSDGTVVTVVTEAQEMGKTYKFSVQSVTDLSGNVVDKTDFYVGGVVDNVKPTATVVVNADATVTVSFDEKVNKETAQNVSNYVIDPALNVKSATLNSDGNKVTLVTDVQELSKTYKVTVQNVADLAGNVIDKKDHYFGGIVDAQKPTANVTNNGDGSLNVAFNEKVNKEQAENVSNYTIDTGLAVKSATLNSDGNAVTLVTDKQENSKTYKLTIQNIADLAATPNVIEKKDYYFGGIVDTAGPEVTTATSTGATTVVLQFNEKLNKDLAQDPTNYVVDGDLKYPTKAVYDDATQKVTLTTAKQTAGKLYTVSINNLKDKSGNVITSGYKKTFGGTSSSTAAQTKLLNVSTVNQNTIDLVFDQEISDADLNTNLGVDVVKFDGTAVSVTAVTYETLRQTDKKIVRVQFKNSETNPALFTMGNNYKVTATGVANLVTTDSANTRVFSGTSVANEAPKFEHAVAINNTSVKIRFTEDVLFNSTVAADTYQQFKIGDLSIIGIQTDVTKPVREVVLNLGTPLASGQTYTASLNTGSTIKDAAGFNAIKSDTTAYVSGTTVANSAPKIQFVNVTDKNNFDIVFTEAVENAANAEYVIEKTAGPGTVPVITKDVNATFTASSDKTKLTVNIWSTTGTALDPYSSYTVKVKDTSVAAEVIKDLQNTPLKSADNVAVNFAGTSLANAQPIIAAVDAVISGADKKTLTVKAKFSEVVTGTANLEVVINGQTIVVAVTLANADNTTFTVTTTDAMAAGNTGTIKVSNDSTNLLLDVNKQKAKTDATSFATK
ncbi:Ig-like domain-containing protein [Paenibacillus sp. MBLB4367]|uniref:Ig-like domain-containing protein n=1 Tax=Paenibacillus sp. MBLB4367 TaxID=3384767 RepID=UPI0039080EBD